MKKNKALLTIVIGCMTVVMLYSIAAFAAPAKNAKYSVDAAEIEYDMKSGDGTTTGKTTIKYDGGVAVGQGGSTFNSKNRTGRLYGGVVADKEDNHLKSKELIFYTDKFISAVGNAILVKGDKTLKAHRVDYHDDKQFAETMGGFAHLSSVDGSWLSAGKIVYDMNRATPWLAHSVRSSNITDNFLNKSSWWSIATNCLRIEAARQMRARSRRPLTNLRQTVHSPISPPFLVSRWLD